MKTDGHYAGDLVSLDFKSESLHAFLENVVQLVNHHSQRINALEIDKMAIESVRIANSEYYAATKIPPMLAKELTLPSGGQAKFETHSESVNALSSNFKMHCNGTLYITKQHSISMKNLREPMNASSS